MALNLTYIYLRRQVIMLEKTKLGKISNDTQIKKTSLHKKGKMCSACLCIKYTGKHNGKKHMAPNLS